MNIYNIEKEQYFYHSDHLGSSAWITDAGGYVNQHLQYMPFGETFVDQRNTKHDIRFKFTGKERDAETGLDYFGARYYDSDISVWLSVDPLADKYPSLSPYAYVANNPIMLVDPNGMEIIYGTTKKEIRKNKRQMRRALRRARRKGDTEFINRYNKWNSEKDNEYYVYREKGATELERSKAIECGAENQYNIYYDIKRRGKRMKELNVSYFIGADREIYKRQNNRFYGRNNKKARKYGIWFEAHIDSNGKGHWKIIGWGFGNYSNYNIWGGKRKKNPNRPLSTNPKGPVIKWKTREGKSWIGIIYYSKKPWRKEK